MITSLIAARSGSFNRYFKPLLTVLEVTWFLSFVLIGVGIARGQEPTRSSHPANLQSGPCDALRNSPRFTYAYGYVTLNDSPAPVGSVIKAFSPRSELVGCWEIQEAGVYPQMPIYGEDLSVTPPIPGMREDEIVTFTVSDLNATATPVLVWQNDKLAHQVDLSSTIPADLSITKTDTPDPVVAGSTLTYALSVTNAGPNPATNVILTDNLPSGVTYVSATPSQGSCNGTSTITCSLDSLEVQSSATVTVVVTVKATTRGSLSNTASVTANQSDPNPSNNSAVVSTTVNAKIDLGVTKLDSPDPVIAGNNLTYSISIINNGPSTANSVVMTDNLPTGVTWVSTTPSQGSCSGTSTIICNLMTLYPQVTATISIVVKVNPSTRSTLSNTASVTATETDTNPANNSTTATTTVNARVDLALTKSDSPDPVIAGSDLNYTLTIVNNGPSTATGVSVTDNLPSALTLISADPSQGTCEGISAITCNLNNLDPQVMATISIVAQVKPDQSTSLLNTANVSAVEIDTNSGNNTDTETTTVIIRTDLTITKSDDPDPVIAGYSLNYSLVVANNGPSKANSVSVTDSLPAGTTLISATPSQGTCTGTTTITCNLGILQPQGVATIDILVQVNPSTRGTLTNNASVTGINLDPDLSNNSASEATTVTTAADLVISKSDLPDPVVAGDNLTFSLTVFNGGPSAANDVTVTDNLPTGVTLVLATPSQGSCNGSVTVVCSLGSMSSSGTATVSLVVTVNPTARGILTNIASVAIGETEIDPNPANNSATTTTTINVQVDLGIVKTDNLDPVTAGNDLIYSLTVTNAGPSTANDVSLSDSLPTGVVFDSVIPSQGNCEGGNTVTCNLESLSPGDAATVSIIVEVDPSLREILTNTAIVTTSDPDTNLNNNSDTETTNVSALADLSITQSSFPDPVVAGRALTYTLLIVNNGPSTANDIIVTDTLPLSVTLVSITPGCNGVSLITCSLDTLPPQSTSTITIVVTISPSTRDPLTNGATVSGTETDPILSNNTASATTTVNAETDLSILKSDDPDPVIAGNDLFYSLTVTNSGPSTASSVVVTDTLPAGITLISVTPEQGSCSENAIITCSLGNLPSSATTAIRVSVAVNPSTRGILTNVADVTGMENDPDLDNNSVSIDTGVTATADLSVTQDVYPDPVVAGENLTYTLSVVNLGPSTANSITLTDTLPSDVELVSITSSQGNCIGETIIFCSLGTLAPSGSATVNIVVTVNPDKRGKISNIVSIMGAETDPALSNNTVIIETNISPAIDLVVTQTDNPDPVVAGENLTYTLSVANNGPSTANSVTVTDSLPVGVSLVSTVPGQGDCSGTTPITCNLGSMPPQETVTIIVSVTTSPSARDMLTNTVTVTAIETDLNPDNNLDAETTPVDAIADLSVTKSDSLDPVIAGELLIYSISVVNHGPSDATDVGLTDYLPSGVTLILANPSQGDCSGATTLLCSFGTLSPQATVAVSVTVVVSPATRGELNNITSVTGAETDPNTFDNTATATTAIVAAIDLGIIKSDTPNPVIPGNNLTYSITVSNIGPSTANDVAVTDSLPMGVTLVSTLPSQGSCSGIDPLVCSVGSLSPQDIATIQVVVAIAPSVRGVLTNTASVTGIEPDADLTNNTATIITPLDPQTDLTLSKTDFSDPVVAGQNLTYTLSIVNNGPSTANGVTVSDDLPSSVTLLSATPSQGNCSETSGPTCDLGVISPRSTATVSVVVAVSPSARGTLTNTADVMVTESDPNPANNSDTETTTIIAQVDLSLNKSDEPDPVIAGAPLTYIINVSNAGPSTADHVVVTDTLPAEVSLVSATPDQGSCTGTTAILCDLGVLSPQSTIGITIAVAVDPSARDVLSNTTNMTSVETDPDPADNTDTEFTTINTQADLGITKTCVPSPVVAGQDLSCTLTITNYGPSTANGVTISDTLPSGVTFVSATPSQGSCVGTTTLSCSLGMLLPQETAMVGIAVTVAPSTRGELVNTASVTGTETDPVSGNDADSESITVTSSADLSLVKSDEPEPVIAGNNLTYMLTVTNSGPSTANSVNVTDSLPAEVTLVSVIPSQGSCSGVSSLTCNLGTLQPQGTVTISVVVAVGPTFRDPISNTACVSGSDFDPNSGNNCDLETTNLIASVDVSVTKSDLPDPVIAGETLTYALAVNNDGPSTASGVIITDTLPAGVTLVTVTPSQGMCGENGVLICDLGTLSPLGTATINIIVDVAPSTRGVLTNTVSVRRLEPDSNPENDADTEATVVTALADLTITKVDTPDPVIAGEPLTYTLTIVNAGPSTANGVIVTDTLPGGVVLQSTSPSQGICSGTNVIVCNLDTLLPQSTATITVVVDVDSSVRDALFNTASVSGAEEDPNTADNSVTSDTTIIAIADLVITKNDYPDPVTAGEELTYTLVIANNGASTANNVTVIDNLSLGVTLLSVTPSQGTCSETGDLTCSLGNLLPHASATVDIMMTVTPSVRGVLTNTVSMTATEPDPVQANNTDTEITTVNAIVDLSIDKTDSTDPVVAGENLTYTLTIANSGPSTANGITVTDNLPAEVILITATPSQGSCDGENLVSCSLGALPPQGTATVHIVTNVDSLTRGSLVNTAIVTAIEEDPLSENNTVTVTTAVDSLVDLTLSKEVAIAPIIAGGPLTYTLTVSNLGPSAATDVTITDTLPTETTFSQTVPVDLCELADDALICHLGELQPQAGTSFAMVVQIDPSVRTAFTNTATVAAAETDNNPPDNTSAASVTPNAEVDLAVTSSDNPDPVVAGRALTYTLVVSNQGLSDATGTTLTDTLPAGVTFVGASPGCDSNSGVITCGLGTLAPQAATTVTLTVTVGPDTRGSLTNAVLVASDEYDPNQGNNTAAESTGIISSIDLEMTKSDLPDPVIAGENLTYTLSIGNSGPSTANNVTVTDALPSGVSLVSVIPGQGNCSEVSPITCSLGSLSPQATVTVEVIVTVNPTTRGSITNTVSVTATEPDTNPANNATSETTTVAAQTDLSIVKLDEPDPVVAGEHLTYTLTATNNGPSTANGVVVTDTLPADVLLVSAHPSQGSCDGTDIIVCNLGTLYPQNAAIITIVVGVDSSTRDVLVNTASVSAVEVDPEPIDNLTTIDTTIISRTDLWITKSGYPDPIVAGEMLTYTLIVANSGSSTANGVIMTDTLPVSATLITVTPSQGSCTGMSALMCNLGSLDPGTAASINVTVSVNSSARDKICNTAQVNGSEYDPYPENNLVIECTSIVAYADLSIIKRDDPDPAVAGEYLTYTLVLTNQGPSTANSVSVTDTLPVSVTLISVTPGQGVCSENGDIACDLGVLSPSYTATVELVTAVSPFARGALTNTTSAAGDESDPDPSNNSVNETTNVIAVADLAIAKKDSPDPVTAGEFLTYTLTITNSGPSAAYNVILSDTLPMSVTLVSAIPSQGSCVEAGDLTCNWDVLPPEAVVTVSLVVAVDPSARNILINTACVSAIEFDPDPENNCKATITSIVAMIDLSIAKSDVPDPVVAGENLTYTLVVANDGLSTANGVTVLDHLPVGVSLVSATPGQGNCSGEGELTCSLGRLLPQSAATISVVVAVDPQARGVLTNTGNVTGDETDTDPTNNQAAELTIIQAIADLRVSKFDTPDPAIAGTILTYTLSVVNDGPSGVTGVVLTDTLPNEVILLSAFASQGNCDQSGSVLCELGALLPDFSAMITLTVWVDPTARGAITNTATVTSVESDPQPMNNTVEQPTTLEAEINLNVVKSAFPDPVTAGESLTYTVLVGNLGPSLASGVNLTDTLPLGVTLIAMDPSQGDCQDDNPLLCALGSLWPQVSATVTATVRVNPETRGMLTNTVAISGLEFEPQLADNTAAVTTTVQAEADLRVGQSVIPDPVTAGDMLTYTLVVTNAGPSNATSVTLTDSLPVSVTLTSVIPSQGSCTGTETVSCNLGSVPPQATATITLTADVNPETRLPLTNTVSVESSEPDPDMTNNMATVRTTVVTLADLSTAKLAHFDTVTAGELLTYTLIVTNIGPSTVTDISITDTLPVEAIFVTSEPGLPTCAEAGGVVLCELDELSPYATATLTITAVITPTGRGVITNTFTATGLEPDPVLTDNTASVTTTLNAEADLVIVKGDEPDPMTAGDILTYTLIVTNQGPSQVTGVMVTDTLPVSLTLISISPSQGSCHSAEQPLCALGELRPGYTATIVLSAEVDPATRGSITNTARVSGIESDPDSTNNIASQSTLIGALTDLTVVKIATPEPVVAGETLTYTITVTNNGPSTANGVILTDTLPSGVTLVGVDPDQGSCNVNGVVVCTVSVLPPLARASVGITVTVNAETRGALTNTVDAIGIETDLDLADNTAVVTTTLLAAADLSISGSVSPNPVIAGQPLTYTFTLLNLGPSQATSATVTDTLPVGVTPIRFMAGQGSCDVISMTCTLGDVMPQSVVTLTLLAEVNPATRGALVNEVVISGVEPDPNELNNTASLTATVNAQADLTITKTIEPDPVYAGNTLTYTLTITNGGPSTANNIRLADNLPIDLTLLAVTPDQGSCNDLLTLRCDLGGLSPQAVTTVRVVAALNPAARGALMNLASVAVVELDPDPLNNSDTLTTTIVAASDLIVVKTGYPDPVIAGEFLTYTLIVSNLGPAHASNVTVTDTLPAGMVLISVQPEQDCNIANPLICIFDTLTAGATVTITAVTQADSTLRGTITNTVNVAGDEDDPVPVNNTAVFTTTVIAQVDLIVSKSDSPDPVFAGNPLTYTITVANAGSSAAAGVILTDTLPSSVELVSVDPGQGSCNADDPIVCDLNILLPQHVVTLTIATSVLPSFQGILTNTVTVNGVDYDTDLTNNTTTVTTLANQEANLVLAQSDFPDPAVAGENLTYTLNITNTGPSDATGVVLTDTLPSGVNLLAVLPTQGNCSGTDTIICVLGNLQPQATAWVTLTLDVNAETRGITTNTAIITGNETDPDPGNNFSVANTTISGIAALSVIANDAPDPVIAGSELAYVILVANDGPSLAMSVTVTDILPAEVTLLSADSSQGDCPLATPLICNLGNLSKGNIALIDLRAAVNPEARGVLTNTVSVASAEYDPNPDDNMTIIASTVIARADLSLTKSVMPEQATAGSILTYTLTVMNDGPSTTNGIVLTDTLPVEVSLISASSGCGGMSVITCTLGVLPPGFTNTVTVTTMVDPAVLGTIINAAEVAGEELDLYSGNNTASVNTSVNSLADLVLTEIATPSSVNAGEPLTYTLTVLNDGPSLASAVMLTDTLPDAVTLMAVIPSDRCGGTNLLTCDLGDLPPQARETITVIVSVNPARRGVLVNTATTIAQTPDPNLDNNGAILNTPVRGLVDMAISLTSDPDLLIVGETLTYTAVVTNHGPSKATTVKITDDLPANLGLLATSAGCSGTRLVVCELGDLTVSATATVTITVTPLSSGVVTNKITVSAQESDSNDDNNTATVTTVIGDSSVILDPNILQSLVYTDSLGNTTTVSVPAGAISETLKLLYSALLGSSWPPPQGFAMAGHAFTLDIYQNTTVLPGFTFNTPITITIQYSDADVAGLDEDKLALQYWSGTVWQDAADTCSPPSIYERRLGDNWLAVPICHLSEFALFAEPIQSSNLFLPLILNGNNLHQQSEAVPTKTLHQPAKNDDDPRQQFLYSCNVVETLRYFFSPSGFTNSSQKNKIPCTSPYFIVEWRRRITNQFNPAKFWSSRVCLSSGSQSCLIVVSSPSQSIRMLIFAVFVAIFGIKSGGSYG